MNPQPSNQTAALEELQALCTRIRNLLSSSNINCYQIGVTYNEAVDGQLAEKAGYKNAQEFFCANIKDLSRTTLVTYGAVVRVYTQEACIRYGMSALNLLSVYAEAAGSELDPKDPGTMLVEAPSETGELETKFFGECTVADLRAAIQRLRRPTSSAPLPSDTLARVEQCRAQWVDYFPKNAGVRVEMGNRRGKAFMSLKGIPLEQMEQLTALLGTALRPARAA